MPFHILSGFHHTDLWRSFVKLFEGRLGGKLYRPLGEHFYHHNYFFNGNEKESLGLLGKTNFNPDTWVLPDDVPSHYPYGDDYKDWNWVTLDEVSQKITHILISNYDSIASLKRLQKKICPKAKLWRYVGNEDEVLFPQDYDLILAADLQTYERFRHLDQVVRYHPELDSIYLNAKHKYNPNRFVVRNFLNFFWKDDGLSDRVIWGYHKSYLEKNGIEVYLHGLGTPPGGDDYYDANPKSLESLQGYLARNNPIYLNREKWPNLDSNDGEPQTHQEISSLLTDTQLMWHYKKNDGFGYMLHQAAAIGTPIIVGKDQYKGKTGGEILVDGETCVEIDGTIDDLSKISITLQRETNQKLSNSLRKRFIDFNHSQYESEAGIIEARL